MVARDGWIPLAGAEPSLPGAHSDLSLDGVRVQPRPLPRRDGGDRSAALRGGGTRWRAGLASVFHHHPADDLGGHYHLGGLPGDQRPQRLRDDLAAHVAGSGQLHPHARNPHGHLDVQGISNRSRGRNRGGDVYAGADSQCGGHAGIEAGESRMNSARHRQVPPGRTLIFAALCGYALWVIFPMIWMAYSSLKSDEAIFREPFTLPAAGQLRFDNYGRAWREAHFGDYFFNSVLVT